MIFTDRTITVRKGESRIDEPIVVYRGDYELEVRFIILNSNFKFMSGTNMIESEKASYGQLAILTPYGGNVFSDIVKCEDGTVTFTLTKEMIDQLEEVGLYSFQIRLFDYYRESRVSIPPVEFGIEVREPVASEDHDNTVNNAIVGYSIAKVVDGLKEDIPDTFDDNGNYNKTNWKTGDRISQGKLNKIEDAIDKMNQNEKNDVATLDKRITNNFNVLESNKADRNEVNSKVWGMANMGQDVKKAMTGGSVAVVGENTILNENIVDGQITPRKINNIETPYYANMINLNDLTYNCYYDGNSGIIKEGSSSTGLNCITPLYPAKSGEQYYSSGAVNAVVFATDKTYIGRGNSGPYSGHFTVPDNPNIAYIAFSLRTEDIDAGLCCIRRNEYRTKVNTDYVVNLPELMPNDLLISDVWILKDEGSKFNFRYDSAKITVEWNKEALLYFTYSYKSQDYIAIPSDAPLVLNHNESWVYNIHTKEFRIIKTSSADNGSGDLGAAAAEWHHAIKGDILLLKNADGYPRAGRLAEYFKTKYMGEMTTTYTHLFWTGARATCTKSGSGSRKLSISGGTIYAVYKHGGNKNISLSGGIEFDIPTDKNTQLIWDTISNEIRLEPQGTSYNVKPHEILLLYFQYAVPVSGEMFKYMSNARDNAQKDAIIVDVYDRFEKSISVTKSGTTITLVVDHTQTNPWKVYVLATNTAESRYNSTIPQKDTIVDEITGEETQLNTTTWVLPHNGMLYFNRITSTYHVELMTNKNPYCDELNGDILLLLNIDGKFVAGELRDIFNERLLRNEIGSIVSSDVKHDMGRLKFKFDVDPGGSYISSESLVGDELWVFPVSNDEGTNFIKATRYKVDFENNSATEVGSFTHNWGHVNSSAYNPWRDALICGNGSGSYDLMGQIFIFENASSFKDRTQVNRSEAVTINVQEWGYKANVIWGESNMGRGDICYVITNDAQNVRKLQLGMGANNLGSGVMLGDRNDSQFNGTYQVLGEWTLPRIDVVQGSNYENGALYIGLGHDTAWYTKNHLHDDGFVTYETYKEKFYNADGSQLKCNMQGITVTDKYIILGLQGGSLPTNQIHVYYR